MQRYANLFCFQVTRLMLYTTCTPQRNIKFIHTGAQSKKYRTTNIAFRFVALLQTFMYTRYTLYFYAWYAMDELYNTCTLSIVCTYACTHRTVPVGIPFILHTNNNQLCIRPFGKFRYTFRMYSSACSWRRRHCCCLFFFHTKLIMDSAGSAAPNVEKLTLNMTESNGELWQFGYLS